MKKIENILILGSTLLTQLCVEKIQKHYNLVGFVPTAKPTKKGKLNLKETSINEECDIKLSIQYDRIVKDVSNSFNLHTGLLPEYGGTNVLDYAIKNKEKEQGLTFHKMTEEYDHGPIISKISYPILPNETSLHLFKRILIIGPDFLLASLKLLESIPEESIGFCDQQKPKIYKRGEFPISEEMKRYKHE